MSINKSSRRLIVASLAIIAISTITFAAGAASPHSGFIDGVREFFGFQPTQTSVLTTQPEELNNAPAENVETTRLIPPPVANTCIWIGATSIAWETATNWSSCASTTPQPADTAVINSAVNQPTISSTQTIAALTLNTGTTLTISSSTLTVNGDIGLNADGAATTTLSNTGGLNQTAGTMTLARTAVAGTATINLSGTGTWNINNLTTSTTTTNYNLTNGATYTIAGDFTRTNAGTFSAGTSTVAMTGSGKQINGGGATTFNNLTIGNGASITHVSSAGNITIAKDLTVAGTFTQDAARTTTFSFSGTSNLTGGGSITFGNVTVQGGTTLNAGSQSLSVVGATFSVSSTGVFSGSTSTVTFNGAVAQVVSGTGTRTFNNLTINNSNGLTLNSASTVNGTLTLTNGTFTNTAILSLGNGATVSRATGTLSSAPTFGTSVNVSYTGSTAITTGNEVPATSGVVNNLTINKSGGVTLGGNLSAATLNVTAGTFDQGATFSISTGTTTVGAAGNWQNTGTGDLTLSGNVSNAGTISFNSDGGSCGADNILIRSSVNGMQRAWSGAGTFSMTDVDVKDQAGSAAIIVLSGTNSLNNGVNWVFVPTCTSGTYTWTGTALASWAVAANWTPARTTPNSSDILIIDGNVTPAPIITGIPNETDAALRLTNGAQATLRSATNNTTLTLNGATGTDLDVPAGNLLTLDTSNALTVGIGATSMANIAGIVLLDGGSHRLLSNTAGRINFLNGGFGTTTSTFTGNAFGDGSGGNGAAGSVTFASGSKYFHNGGNSPFGSIGNSSVAVFQTGSEAVWLTSAGFQGSGRSYANLSIGNTGPAVSVGDSGAGSFSVDDLKVESSASANSAFSFTGSGAGTVTLRGNIIFAGNGTGIPTNGVTLTRTGGLVDLTSNAHSITFTGTRRTVTFGGNTTVPAGGSLALGANVIVTSPFVLTVGGSLTGDANGYVIGNLKKTFTATGTKTFEVGTANAYSPVDVNATAGTFPADFTVLAVQGAHPNIPTPAKALSRYWTLTSPGSITADLTFHYASDAIDVPGTANESNFVIQKYSGGVFTQPGGSVNTAANTASITGVTSFSDWTLAEPDATVAGDFFRSVATGNWNAPATWQSSHSGTFADAITATLAPDSNANTITVRSPHVVTVTAAVTVDQVTVDSGGTLSVSTGQTLTIADGAGTDLTDNGTVTVDFGGVIVTNGTVANSGAFNENGVWQINNLTPITGIAPIYGSSALLKYATSGTFTRGLEWSSSTSLTPPGFPTSVQIANNTLLDLTGASSPALAKKMSGNLTIDSGSTLSMNVTPLQGGFTVQGTVTDNGTLVRASTGTGAFVVQGSSFTVGASGTYTTSGGGPLKFSGASTQTWTDSSGTQNFGDVVIQTSGGAGIMLNSAVKVGTLTLTSGIVTTTGTNLLTVTNTSSGAVINGSSTSYINGPIARALPASLGSGSTYLFPVGKTTYQPFEMVNPTTSVAATIKAEEFEGSSGGTSGTGIGTLKTNRYWQATTTSGSFTDTSVRLSDSTVAATNLIGKSATQGGAYDSIGGIVSGGTILSNTITSFSFFNIAAAPVVTYTIIYDGNTNTGGLAPIDPSSPYASGATVTVQSEGTLTKTGFTFAGWNTAANGSGTPYLAGQVFAAAANLTMFAQWTAIPTLGTYANTPVALSGNATITPSATPTNTTSITATTSSNFKGTFTANPATGVVKVTDAHPAGAYTVSVKPFNGVTPGTAKTFTLTVANGTACGGTSGFNSPSPAEVAVGANPAAVAVGDFNGDGNQDFASADQGSAVLSIRLGVGNGTFTSPSPAFIGVVDNPISIAVGDFNGDGNVDLASVNILASSVSIRLGVGNGTFTSPSPAEVVFGGFNDHRPFQVVVGDFNSDGKLDFAVANEVTNNVVIRLGNGDGTFVAAPDVAVGTAPHALAIGDFDGDGKLDIATANSGSNNVSIRRGVGDGTFTSLTDVATGAGPNGVAIGDFNGDTKQDLAINNFSANSVSIRYGDGAGGFTTIPGIEVTVGNGPRSVVIGDFNNDGKQDFAVTNFNAATVSIRHGDGLGAFTSPATPEVNVGSNPYVMAIGDVNADGRQDLLVPNYSSANVSVRLGSCALAPSIAKSFDAASINVGQTSVLTITVTNPNPSTALTGVGYADTLPPGLTVPDSSTSACGGTLAIASNVISLSAATIAGSGTCVVTPTVTGATAGVKNNLTNNVTSTNGGTGNTAAASITVITPPETDVAVASGSLTITDANGGTTNDTLTISCSPPNIIVNDPNNTLNAGAGTTQVDPNTVSIPVASITGNITVNTLGGNDTLTLNLSGCNFIPAGGLTFDGGAGGSDKLVINGGSQGTVTYNYTNGTPGSGSVGMSNFGTINYSNLEPITNTGTAADVIFDLPAGPTAATLADDGTAANGLSTLSGATFEATTFSNPTNSVTINRGNAADTMAVNALPDLNSSITIGSAGSEFSTITFNGAVTLASGKNLAGFALSTISLSSSASNLATSGTGTIGLTTATNISLASGSSIATVNGNLTLNANQQASPTPGGFIGVDVNNGLIRANGTGAVTVKGKGGNGASAQKGVLVQGGGDIIGGTGTLLTIEGTGGAGSGSDNYGVQVTGSGSTITSLGANVSVLGTGGAAGVNFNHGVYMNSSGQITSGSSGTVTVEGHGGTGTGGSQLGIRMNTSSSITSGGSGTVTVTGFGGTGPGGAEIGVDVGDGGSTITSGGGNVTVTGTGGTGSNGSNVGVTLGSNSSVSSITSGSSGSVTVTGTGGTGASGNNDGVQLFRAGQITSGGAGNLIIDGTAGGSANSEGFQLVTDGTSPSINSGGGTITITGASTTSTAIFLGGSQGCGSGCNIASGSNAAVTLIGDSMSIHTTAGNISAGSGPVTLRQKTIGVAINLGAATDPSVGPLSLTDAEIDRVTAGTLNIGDANSGAITVSGGVPIDLTDSPTIGTLNLTTGANVIDSNAGTDIMVSTLNITAPTGIGGAAANAELDISATTVTTNSSGTNGDQYLSEADNVTVGANDMNAGGGTINLQAGRFNTAPGGDILSNVVISGTATLGGTGSVLSTKTTTVNSGGTVSPGTSPGILNTGSVSFASGSTYAVEIGGTTPGNGAGKHDQISVTGSVTLGNATLTTAAFGGFTPTAGDTYKIINNDTNSDAVSGTFNGLPEGGIIFGFLGSTLGGKISYIGGDGNDVVITAVSPDYTVTTTGNAIVVTDNAGNGDTLAITEPSAGNIKFAAGTRTFSVNGGPFIIGDSGDISRSGATSITVNQGNGSDTANVGAFTGTLPSLTINGDAGIDAVNLNGDITFTAGNSLIVNAESVSTGAGADLTTSGAGVITFTADDVALDPTSTLVSAGTVTFKPQTASRSIDLGTKTAGQLGLTDAELDRVTCDTLQIGSSSSSSVTIKISAAITRNLDPASINLNTGGGSIIDFNGGSLDANGGNVSLVNAGGGSQIKADASGTDVTAVTLSMLTTAITGNAIGSSANPLRIAVTNLDAASTGGGDIFLSATGTATINATGLSTPSNTVRFDAGTFSLGGSNRINDSTKINVNGATFAIGSSSDTIDTLTLTSGSVTGSGGTLTSTNTIQTNTGSVSAILAGGNGLTQSTSGTTTLSGANTYTGATTINAGTLVVNGSTASGSAVSVNNNGTLGGQGTVGGTVSVASGGTVAPGTSPGILNTGNVSFASGSTFAVEIGGTTPGNAATNHDQLNVTGTVALGGSTLTLTSFGGFVPLANQTFTIVNNDLSDAVSGTFNGLAQGAAIPNFLGSGLNAKISYTGGTNSNDVVITVDPTPNFVVTKTADTNDGLCDADCSLREAVAAANANVDTNTITFNIPGTDGGCVGPVCTITLGGTQLVISNSVNISGTGANKIKVNGNNLSRIFTVNTGTTVAMNSFTISGGRGARGGGIENNGTLTLTVMTLSGNTSTGDGGAVANDGIATVINSTLSGNTAAGDGGAILNGLARTLTIVNSTIAGNTGGNGGGILSAGILNIRNTIVALNTATNVVSTGGTFTDQGNNILTGDPLIGALQDNGGPTFTRALQAASTAIDTGNDCVLTTCSPAYGFSITTDQRGVVRPIGTHVDIGAFERETCATAPANMIGWYSAEGNANDIVGTNNGTMLNGATFAPGKVGQAFIFNGTNQFVNVPNSPTLNPADEITVDAWVNTVLGGVVVSKGDASNGTLDESFSLGVTGSGLAVFNIWMNSGNLGGYSLVGVTPINNGQWHHIAGTYINNGPGNGFFRIFVDGVLDNSSNNPGGALVNNSNPLTIGVFNGNSSTYFNGEIDEVEIFNRVLTATEISNIVTSGTTGKCHTSTIQFSSPTYSVSEAGPTATITATRFGAHDTAATVDYATVAGGTATPVDDYNAISATTLNFAIGAVSNTFPVTINEDLIHEADETVFLALTNVTGASAGAQSTATLTIIDNDAPPTISITDVTQPEGNSGPTTFGFNVTLSAVSGLPVTVHYQTADGTATTANSDYVAIPDTTLTINAGNTSAPLRVVSPNVLVTVNGDTTYEADETFFVNLTNPMNATIAKSQGVGTILNDDAPPASLVVTKTADTSVLCVPGNCSLREAINAANFAADVNTITFAIPGGGAQIILLGSQLPNITQSVNITGPNTIGPNQSITVQGNDVNNVFVVRAGTTNISGLTVSHGSGSLGTGGGLFVTGATAVANASNMLFRDNTVVNGSGGGAGVATGGTLRIRNSTFSGNTATNGGALYVSTAATLDLVNVTVTNNVASGNLGAFPCQIDGNGGGIDNAALPAPTLTIRNSVIANNTDCVGGGGVANAPEGGVANAPEGGGGQVANPNVIAAFTDLGNNITSVGSNPPPADPQVGPLADNGGTTFTRALIAGSAAIDAGNNCILTNACSPAYGSNITTDQRGNVRPQDGDGNGSSIVDIGAYESANIAPTVISINRANANPTNAASVDFTVTFSESVTGGGTSNFSTTTTSTASGAISGVTGSGATRTVTVSSITGEGTLRLNMANSNGVTDSDGAAVSNLPFTTGQVYTIDRIAPDTTILTNPPSLTNSTSAVFTFSGTDVGTGVASFECKLDAGSFTACVSGQSYSSLSSASHTFQVRAIDNVGNVDASPASYTWTVDAIAPSVTINQAAGQADPTNTSPILFTVVFNEPVTGFTSNSGDVVLSGASGANAYTVSGGPSTYTVSVTGMNANGNVTATVPVGAAFDAAGNGNAASTSTDNSVTFVATIPTTTVINSDLPDPSGVGQAVTVNYTVAAVGPPPPVNGPSVPTPIPGNVTVTDSLSAATCTATAAAGTCNIVLPNAGARTLTATYGGSGNYLVSSGTAAHLVDGPPAAAATAANVVTPGAATYTFTVTYTDDIAMNVSTLDGGDVRITGPASFNAAATFVSVNLASNGTPRTATYSIVPPGGTWDGIDNGAYSVVMQGSQVADTFGNFVPAGTIGGFIVNIPTISISGNIKQYVAGGPNTNLAGVTVTLSGSSAATTPTDASGNYSFANLISGGSFVVTPTLTGKVFEPITRTYNGLATNVTNADFVAYTDPGGVPRNLKVVNSFVVPGQTVSVPVVLTSLGNEAFVSFSLAYDSNLFSINPTAVCGANAGVCSVTVNNTTPGTAGVTVTPAALFTAGQQEVVRVMFQSLATNASNTPITFGSSPVAKLIKDANNNPLPSTYTDGLVVFTQGLESDIATRNTGDGQLLATDMPLIRQAVVGTLVLNPAFNEFQRVDSAPIATKGDGQLDSTDIVIARRYVARIEEPQTAGGPTQPLAGAPEPLKETADAPTYGRRVHIVSANATPGGKAAIPVEMDIQGDEVATSFTLDFDPSKLTNPVVTLGSGTPKSATLTTNIAEKGKLGILVDSAEVFAGRQILTITFDIAADAGGGATPIIFTNALAAASVSDGIGGQLTTRYEDGAVTISGTAASLVSISGRVVTPDGRGLRNATVSITDQNGATRRTTTGAFGHYNFDAIAPGRNYRIAVASRQYRFAARTIEVVDNLSDVDFTGSE